MHFGFIWQSEGKLVEAGRRAHGKVRDQQLQLGLTHHSRVASNLAGVVPKRAKAMIARAGEVARAYSPRSPRLRGNVAAANPTLQSRPREGLPCFLSVCIIIPGQHDLHKKVNVR